MGTPSTHLTSSALGRLSKARYGLRSKSDGRVNDGMMTQGRATGHRKGDATKGWAPCAQRHWRGGWKLATSPLVADILLCQWYAAQPATLAYAR